jgi:serine/threonine protein kinase
MHRDIKPDNIIFFEPGNLDTLKIVDFGLAINFKCAPYLYPKLHIDFIIDVVPPGTLLQKFSNFPVNSLANINLPVIFSVLESSFFFCSPGKNPSDPMYYVFISI